MACYGSFGVRRLAAAFQNVQTLVLVQKQLVVRASRLHMQPGRPHYKNTELMLDRYLINAVSSHPGNQIIVFGSARRKIKQGEPG